MKLILVENMNGAIDNNVKQNKSDSKKRVE